MWTVGGTDEQPDPVALHNLDRGRLECKSSAPRLRRPFGSDSVVCWGAPAMGVRTIDEDNDG